MIDFSKTLKHFEDKDHGKKFAKSIKCEDYLWGTMLEGEVNCHPREEERTFDIKDLEKDNVLVIIAESPHKDEFSFDKQGSVLSFKSPLHRCDKRIKKHLENNLTTYGVKKLMCDVVLVNAIQYQCSFGLGLWGHPDNQKQRDEVFEWTWCNQPAEKDLRDRIAKIISGKTSVIILNCCTKNLKKYCNASLFQKTNSNQNFLVFDEPHPSTW